MSETLIKKLREYDLWVNDFDSDLSEGIQADLCCVSADTIEQLTKERDLLVELLKKWQHMDTCQQEGISSGQPSMQDWLDFGDEVSELLANLKEGL